MINNQSTMYLFSALIQANAALFALVGIFIIYKLQTLQSEIQSIRLYIIDASSNVANSDYIMTKCLAFNEMFKEERIKCIKELGDGIISKYFLQWHNILENISKIKTKIKIPTIFVVIQIIYNILFLAFPVSNSLCQLLVVVLAVIFQIIILITITYQIFYIIKLR